MAASSRLSYRPRDTAAPGGLTTALIFLPPALVLFTLFIILPIGEAAWYSFFNWNGLGPLNNFIGLRQLRSAAEPLGLPPRLPQQPADHRDLARRAAAAGARLWRSCSPSGSRGAVAFRMIFFLPYILADVAAGLIWRFMFDGDFGPISYLVQWFGYRAALPARRPRARLLDRADGDRVEVFRLPHDALHRRPAEHRPQPLRGGRRSTGRRPGSASAT